MKQKLQALCFTLLLLFYGGATILRANAAGISIPQEAGSYINMDAAKTSGDLTLSNCKVDGTSSGKEYAIGSTKKGSSFTLSMNNSTAGNYVLSFNSGTKNYTAEISVEIKSGDYQRVQNFSVASTSNYYPLANCHYMLLNNLPAGDIAMKVTISSTTDAEKGYAGNYGNFCIASLANYNIANINLSGGIYSGPSVGDDGSVGYCSNGGTATYIAYNPTNGVATLNMGLVKHGEGTITATVTDIATSKVELTKVINITNDVCNGYDSPTPFELGSITKGLKEIQFVIATEDAYLCNYKNVGITVQKEEGAYENTPVTATWPMGDATPSAKAVVTGEGADVAFCLTNYSSTENFTVGTKSYGDNAYTTYSPDAKQNSINSGYYVEYKVKTLNGMTFNPSTFSLSAMRFGTNGGCITLGYSVDGGSEIISTVVNNINPNRNQDSNLPTVLSHEFSDVSVKDELVVRLYIYNLDAGRNVGIFGVTLAGSVDGKPQTESITVGSTGFATVGLPYATTLPEEVKAYAVTDVTATNVTLTEVAAGTNIAANTGLIITAKPGTYTFPVCAEGVEIADNVLVANTEADKIAETEGEFYVLAVTDEASKTVGLAQIAQGGVIAKNRAYMPASVVPEGVSGQTSSLRLVFGNPTAVKEVAENGVETVETVVYNLAGQRVRTDAKGMVIVKGRKYLKK